MDANCQIDTNLKLTEESTRSPNSENRSLKHFKKSMIVQYEKIDSTPINEDSQSCSSTSSTLSTMSNKTSDTSHSSSSTSSKPTSFAEFSKKLSKQTDQNPTICSLAKSNFSDSKKYSQTSLKYNSDEKRKHKKQKRKDIFDKDIYENEKSNEDSEKDGEDFEKNFKNHNFNDKNADLNKNDYFMNESDSKKKKQFDLNLNKATSSSSSSSSSKQTKTNNSDGKKKEKSKKLYCICQSDDTQRFMIACDNCDEWYHGDCVGVTLLLSKKIKAFYCHLCRLKNSSLNIKYRTKFEEFLRKFSKNPNQQIPANLDVELVRFIKETKIREKKEAELNLRLHESNSKKQSSKTLEATNQNETKKLLKNPQDTTSKDLSKSTYKIPSVTKSNNASNSNNNVATNSSDSKETISNKLNQTDTTTTTSSTGFSSIFNFHSSPNKLYGKSNISGEDIENFVSAITKLGYDAAQLVASAKSTSTSTNPSQVESTNQTSNLIVVSRNENSISNDAINSVEDESLSKNSKSSIEPSRKSAKTSSSISSNENSKTNSENEETTDNQFEDQVSNNNKNKKRKRKSDSKNYEKLSSIESDNSNDSGMITYVNKSKELTNSGDEQSNQDDEMEISNNDETNESDTEEDYEDNEESFDDSLNSSDGDYDDDYKLGFHERKLRRRSTDSNKKSLLGIVDNNNNNNRETNKTKTVQNEEKKLKTTKKQIGQVCKSSKMISNNNSFIANNNNFKKINKNKEKLTKKLKTKSIVQRRRYRNSSSKSINENDQLLYLLRPSQNKKLNNEPTQCLGPECTQPALTNSKYCSSECGMRLAKDRLVYFLKKRIEQYDNSPCYSNILNQTELEKINFEIETIRVKLKEIEQKHLDLDKVIERAKYEKINPNIERERDRNLDSNEVEIHCVTCGNSYIERFALKHMEKCFNKIESQAFFGSYFKTHIDGQSMFCDYFNSQTKMYCKRLRVMCPEHEKEKKVNDDEVCGCPLPRVDNLLLDSDEICLASKRTCSIHYKWEKLRRAQIDLEKLRTWLKLEELLEHKRMNENSLNQRAGLLSVLLHQTTTNFNNFDQATRGDSLKS